MPAESSAPRRASRLRLYLPFALLILLGVGWSIAWFVIRGRVVTGLDEWLAAEAAAGRQWTCRDRSAGGYPFRVELACSSLSLDRPGISASVGRVVALAQVYSPGHVIVEAAGPLKLRTDTAGAEADWRLLQASVVSRSGAFQRATVAADAIRLSVTSPGVAPVEVAAQRLELHGRPDPNDRTTFDLAASANAATVPGLDALVGGTELTDFAVVLQVTKVADLPARPLPGEFDRWRAAGGRVEASRLSLVKGSRRLEGKASIGIDEAHRPQGQIDGQAAGIEGVLGRFIGDRAGLAGQVLGALLGGRRADPASPQPGPEARGPRLRPLPPIRLEGGRVYVGPLAIPGLRIPALY